MARRTPPWIQQRGSGAPAWQQVSVTSDPEVIAAGEAAEDVEYEDCFSCAGAGERHGGHPCFLCQGSGRTRV